MDTNDSEIADLCWKCFESLGKSGKPIAKSEYTVLAAIVCEYNDRNNLKNEKKVVSLSTGTKCYPMNVTNDCENIIVDCHAEPLLKRAFKRYLISLLNNNIKIDDNLIITLFISQLPCGCLHRWKGQSDSTAGDRKPGRGVLCPKPSCIKKIAKWNCLGIQGKHLIGLTKVPLYVNHIVIGNCGQIGEYDQQILNDMIYLKDTDCVTYKPFDLTRMPSIRFCEQFRNDLFIKTESNRSSPTSIVMWSEGNGQIVKEVVAEGRKHGLTKKNISNHRLLISDICIKEDIEMIAKDRDNHLTDMYQNQWNALKKCSYFKSWPLSVSS